METVSDRVEFGLAKAWFLAVRPRTLVAALAPVAVGTALAHAEGASLDRGTALAALAVALGLQIATNLFNDAQDFLRGTDDEHRLGPTRVVQAGMLSGDAVLRAAWLTYAITTLPAALIVAKAGWPAAIVMPLAFLSGWAYTGGPRPLAYLGLGELFVFLFFGLAAVCGSAHLQHGRWTWAMLVAATQVGLLAVALIAVNNLRDIDGDRRSGKRTLAVKLGVRGGRLVVAAAVLVPFVLQFYWARQGAMAAAGLPLVALPLALGVARGVAATPPSSAYNRFLAKAGALLLVFSAALAGGLAWH